tara:strand:- start:2698 stop:3408 length:711 start_codon:yes stop_codon:yes gene_type:complete
MNTETEYICNSIINGELFEEPFNHLYINNFFSSNFYNKLLNFLPKKDEYIQINKTKSVSSDYPDERYIFNITPESFDQFYHDQKIFFGELVNSLMSKDFFETVISKFAINGLNTRAQDLNLRMALVKDFSNYNLGAHTDSTDKFMTFLFYLPSDDSHRHIGTSLYKMRESSNKNLSYNSHYSEDQTKELFEEKKLAEFLPNSVLIFPRTNVSYHGVSSINTGSYERNLLLLNYNYK